MDMNNFTDMNIDDFENFNPRYRRKQKNLGFIIFLIIFLTLCVLSVAATVAGVIYVKKNFKFKYNEITSDSQELGVNEKENEDKIVNIALFGIDTTNPNSFKGRSDSIMILSINKTTAQIKLISVLRDSLVPIDHGTWTDLAKVNSAYASGGPETAIKTLNKSFGLDISEYATVNFYGMADIIDTMGGVEVPVTDAEVSLLNSGVKEHCRNMGINSSSHTISKSGIQRLNGIQAVAYSRIRYAPNAEGTANDYGRTDRQRYVLSQLFNSVKSKSKTEYVTLIKALSPCCETSLSYSEIFSLAIDVLLKKPTFKESRVPDANYIMTAPTTDLGAVAYYDLNFAANLIHAFIYEDIKPEDFISTFGIEQNDWFSQGFRKPNIVSYKERLEKAENSQNGISAESQIVAEN